VKVEGLQDFVEAIDLIIGDGILGAHDLLDSLFNLVKLNLSHLALIFLASEAAHLACLSHDNSEVPSEILK
jgi:hypothetical protein